MTLGSLLNDTLKLFCADQPWFQKSSTVQIRIELLSRLFHFWMGCRY